MAKPSEETSKEVASTAGRLLQYASAAEKAGQEWVVVSVNELQQVCASALTQRESDG